jgi:small GTP-binding protein
LSYLDADVFLCCFALNDPASFEHVKVKWFPELRNHCPKVPIIIVGTKLDLRKQNSDGMITTEQGKKLAEELKAYSYLECSAKTRENLTDVFHEVLECHISTKKIELPNRSNGKQSKKLKCCTIV